MNKIIIVSPYADESGLVEKLSEELGSSVRVSVVDTLDEALAVDGVAILSHFSEGVKTLEDILKIDTEFTDTEVIISTHSRDVINNRINELLTDESIDGTDKVSKFSSGAWQIFSIGQRYGQFCATKNSRKGLWAFTQGFGSIFDELVREDINILSGWRIDHSNDLQHQVPDPDPTPVAEHSTVAEVASEPTPTVEPQPVAEPAVAEQTAEQELQTEDEVQETAEVQPTPEPEPAAEVKREETKTETSKPTPEIAADLNTFDPFNIAEAFQASIEEGEAAEQKKDAAGEQPQQPVIKNRNGIPVQYPDVEHTVTVMVDPLKAPGDEFNRGRGFEDWGGSGETLGRVIDRAARKIEESARVGQTPRLSVLEGAAVDVQSDAVGAKIMHEFQYVAKANWSQGIKTETVTMPLIVPIKNPTYGDKKYVGGDAVALLRNRMKIGSTLGVFLPHTGIYCIIVSPTDGELMDTLSVINTQRIETLRASSGILMGNSNYYIHRQVLNLFMNSITNCSFRSWNREMLFELIDERDINIIATALMASVYTDGYEYVQTCGLELEVDQTLPEKERAEQEGAICGNRSEFLADLMRTIFVDNSRLNEFQRTVAVTAIHPRTLEEIKDYQQQHYVGYQKPYEIDDGIQFVYRAQNVKTSMEAGEKWIGEISAIVDSIITFRNDDEERNTMIDHRINLARIREFSHWVEEIIVDGQVMKDREKINELLNSLSRNEKVMLRVSETLGEFQRLSMIAITAIPRVQCPSCQKTDTRDLDISKHLIPQDAVSRLFTLVRQRV